MNNRFVVILTEGLCRLPAAFAVISWKETSFSLKLHGFYASLSSWPGVGSDSPGGCIEVPLQQHLLISDQFFVLAVFAQRQIGGFCHGCNDGPVIRGGLNRPHRSSRARSGALSSHSRSSSSAGSELEPRQL